MPYYCYDRCPEEAVEQIDELARKLGLEQGNANLPNRSWLGGFDDEAYNGFLHIDYDSDDADRPLIVQTRPGMDYRKNPIRDVLKELKEICQGATVSAMHEGPIDLD